MQALEKDVVTLSHQREVLESERDSVNIRLAESERQCKETALQLTRAYVPCIVFDELLLLLVARALACVCTRST